MKYKISFDPMSALEHFGKSSKLDWNSQTGLPVMKSSKSHKVSSEIVGQVYITTKKSDDVKVSKRLAETCFAWQKSVTSSEDKTPFIELSTESGPVWWLRSRYLYARESGHGGQLKMSKYSQVRDLMGDVCRRAKKLGVDLLTLELSDNLSVEELRGVVVGYEMASYLFKDKITNSHSFPKLKITPSKVNKKCNSKVFSEAYDLGTGVNMARHLVNLPAGNLTPKTYAKWIRHFFKSFGSELKISVLEKDELKSGGFGLLRAVGRAADDGPRVVHFRYRPTKKGKKSQQPLAFVGKGVTFDSGGLDIKPSSGMRNMKKDMGGAATLTGLAYWIAATKPPVACDIYLALAENAISDDAFRPGDIIESRSGQTVEIHNTDAEGRLVLADVLDYAITQSGKNAPRQLIDVATLTGAMRVALGASVGGFFTNDEKMAQGIAASSQSMGDFVWRMPLIGSYEPKLLSPVSDLVNAVDGFGGAITAALFLEKFVGDVPWTHMDVYAWRDSVGGPYSQNGGNGQVVQLLANYITSQS